jgi:ubiquitin thioesterase OTU1
MGLSRKANPAMDDPPEIHLIELGGTLLLRIMPDDNSCLFRAIAAATMPGLDTMTELRSIVAQTIQSNSDKYPKVVLDNKEPDEYCRWIQTENAWGGQIELDILARQLDVEICSIDVKSLRVDHYNEGSPNRCIVVYSGIHYDTIALNPFNSPPEDDVKIFHEGTKEEVLPHAVKLCGMLKDRNYYTDTAQFLIKCQDCGEMCKGEEGATAHAMETNHYNFGEAD